MKKLILPLLMLVASTPAFSQIVRSTTFTEKEGRKTEWFARLGLSFNNLTGDAMSEFKNIIKEELNESELEPGEEASAGFGTRTNFDLMFGFNKYFGKTDLYWGMELGLGTRGGSYKYTAKSERENWKYECEEKCYVNTYNVKYVPFTIGYKFPMTDKIIVDAHLGIFASFDFAGAYTEDEWEIRNGEKESYKDSTGIGDDAFCDITRFDAGLQLGLGVWFGRFNLNFNWQRGFAPFIDGFPFGDTFDDAYYNSSNAILSLGVSF